MLIAGSHVPGAFTGSNPVPHSSGERTRDRVWQPTSQLRLARMDSAYDVATSALWLVPQRADADAASDPARGTIVELALRHPRGLPRRARTSSPARRCGRRHRWFRRLDVTCRRTQPRGRFAIVPGAWRGPVGGRTVPGVFLTLARGPCPAPSYGCFRMTYVSTTVMPVSHSKSGNDRRDHLR